MSQIKPAEMITRTISQPSGSVARGPADERLNARGFVSRTMVVILAAGRGSRMGRADLAKVNSEIDGVPAISRMIASFKRSRFRKFLLVVNSHAEQVMAAVAKDHPEAMFAFQPALLGTGHAARAAAEALERWEHDGPVLVTPGDKYIEQGAIDALVDGHIRQRADFTLLTLKKGSSLQERQGRVLLDSTGQAVAIVEYMTIARQAVVDEIKKRLERNEPFGVDELNSVIERHFPDQAKSKLSGTELLEMADGKVPFDRQRVERFVNDPANQLAVDGVFYTASEIEARCQATNPSLYLLEFEAFRAGVRLLDNRNEQQEFYVTDFVRHLPRIKDEEGEPRFRVRTVMIDRGDWIQGFNSPSELLRIQDYVRGRRATIEREVERRRRVALPPSQRASVREWLSRLDASGVSLYNWLVRIYGPDTNVHHEKIDEIRGVLRVFGERFGYDRKVVIVRAPGRINLMGRHIDHRGGSNNFLALDRETFVVAGERDDDRVVGVSALAKSFREIDFSMRELLGQFAWSEWIHFVESDWVRSHLLGHPGEWGNYLKAALLRLQHYYQDIRILGMDLAVAGNIPMAAGLSSSSSLVVGVSQAAIALNNLELTSARFIDLCGQGEWFVGSRGGAGDHAAIYLGQRNKIVRVANLPFVEDGVVDAPEGYRVVIANSHIKASKSASARDLFNSRIASYNLGFALLKERVPEIASRVEHLRDIDPERLGVKTSQIYQILLKVPEVMTGREIRDALGTKHAELIERSFSSHREQEHYFIRGVLLFGIAECARARKAIRLFSEGRVSEFGRLMNLSHDGDRVVASDASGSEIPHASGCSDGDLYRLLADLSSEDPERVGGAQLMYQPGYYACSTPEIDCMADTVKAIEGVAGAQIAGAGLGGCLMILAREDAVDAVRERLCRVYYGPRDLPPAILECSAVEGAGLAEF